MRLSPESLARASSRHPWRTVGVWVVMLVVGVVLSGALLSGALTTDMKMTNSPESMRAKELLDRNFPDAARAGEVVIVHSDTLTATDAAFADYTTGVRDRLADLGPTVIASAVSYYDTKDPSMVSGDGHSALVMVSLGGPVDEMTDHVPHILGAIRADEDPAFTTQVFGDATAAVEMKALAEEDLRKGESVGMMVALVVLVIVFAAVVAGIIPVIMGMVSIAIALGLLGLVGTVTDFSYFITNMVSMMGLAVGIDYSLFIISRYREERDNGFDKHEAIGRAGATANRAVFFSGTIVVLALIGMFVLPSNIFASLAAGAIAVVVVAVLASMTLLPALLSVLGDKIDALSFSRRRRSRRSRGTRVRKVRAGFWDTVTRGVMRRPVVSLLIVMGLLLAFTSPYFFQAHPDDGGHGIKKGSAGITSLPESLDVRQAFDALTRDFSGGLSTPAQVVISGDLDSAPVAAGIERLVAETSADPAFGPALPLIANRDGTVGELKIPLAGVASDPGTDGAISAIERLRTTQIPRAFDGVEAQVLVGGQAAIGADFLNVVSDYTPWIFALVLGLSFLLLTVVFRSVVVPVKAIFMNLLSVGAAYGLIVLVFQDGGPHIGQQIANLFGFQQSQAIEPWLPLFLFSVLFGLSMDYHLFLLTRIREEYDRTGDNSEAVAYGLRTTAKIITGAALIMVTVFGSFAAGQLVMLQQMGFGLAVAVLLDATIVRSVLVPASMKLLGDANWYLPRWLGWLPQLNVEGHVEEQVVHRAILELPGFETEVREPVLVE